MHSRDRTTPAPAAAAPFGRPPARPDYRTDKKRGKASIQPSRHSQPRAIGSSTHGRSAQAKMRTAHPIAEKKQLGRVIHAGPPPRPFLFPSPTDVHGRGSVHPPPSPSKTRTAVLIAGAQRRVGAAFGPRDDLRGGRGRQRARDKAARLGDLLARLEPDDVETAIAFLSGATRQGRLGAGYAATRSASDVAPADKRRSSFGTSMTCSRHSRPSRAKARTPNVRGCSASCSRAPRATSRTSFAGCCTANCGRARSRVCSSRPSRARRT